MRKKYHHSGEINGVIDPAKKKLSRGKWRHLTNKEIGFLKMR